MYVMHVCMHVCNACSVCVYVMHACMECMYVTDICSLFICRCLLLAFSFRLRFFLWGVWARFRVYMISIDPPGGAGGGGRGLADIVRPKTSMYVCMHVCIFVCMSCRYGCLYVCMRVCVYVYLCACVM